MSVEAELITPVDEPTGFYGTLADVNRFGESNLIDYSNLDGEGEVVDGVVTRTINTTRVQSAMDRATVRMDQYLDLNGVTGSKKADGTANTALQSDPFFSLLTESWAYWIVSDLYGARGDRDIITDASGNQRAVNTKAADWERRAATLLGRFVMGKRRNISTSVAFGTARDRLGYFPCG